MTEPSGELAADMAVLEAACSREHRELRRAFRALLQRQRSHAPGLPDIVGASATAKALGGLAVYWLEDLPDVVRKASGAVLAKIVLHASESKAPRFDKVPSDKVAARERYVASVLDAGKELALEQRDARAIGLCVASFFVVDAGHVEISLGYGGFSRDLREEPARVAALLRELAANVEKGEANG